MKIVFEFAGGPLDGKQVIGEPGEEGELELYYALSYHGRLGQRFRTASDYAVNLLVREQLKVNKMHNFQDHQYEITDRREEGERLLLRACYVQGHGVSGRRS
jgi:hypothetical protein